MSTHTDCWTVHFDEVHPTETVGTEHSLPGSVVRADAGVEVTKDNLLVHLRHSCQQGVQVLVEFVLRHVRARHWGSVGADDGGEMVSPKKQAEAHQAINDTLRQTGQTSHDVVPDGKGNIDFMSLCLSLAAPEGVAGTHLLQEGIPCSNESDRDGELALIQSRLLDTQFQWVTSEMGRGGNFKEVREFQGTIQSLQNAECLQEITMHLPITQRE
ncbi:unnamed protein product [Schistocephalus solidus]|uniref:Mediator of RNA polymerase II transcription subunit 20 n=1 Tax=Schistocephalus solidus TaxID=70667 RepID=A0A183S9R8_SCHSO|nr:unnamed protein product [Schistocephalus solidus]